MHFMVACLIKTQFAFYFANEYIFTDEAGFQLPEVPKPLIWQYIWLLSLVPSIVGLMALPRNTLSLLKFYYYGTVGLGLGTCLCTMLMNAADLWDFSNTKETTNTFGEFPVIVLWFMYLFVVIQIHAFGIYFSRVLIQMWSKEASKKKK